MHEPFISRYQPCPTSQSLNREKKPVDNSYMNVIALDFCCRISDASGSMEFTKVLEGSLSKDKLDSNVSESAFLFG